MIWRYNAAGVAFTAALYITGADTTFRDMAVSGLDILTQHYNSALPTSVATNDNNFSPSATNSNGCFTTVIPYYDLYTTASVTTAAVSATGGFTGSNTTCLDYVVDEMSLSGT